MNKVILFASRTRGTNRECRDIDLAIQDGDTVTFVASVDVGIPTPLFIDEVGLDKPVQADLFENIRGDGVALDGKVWEFPQDTGQFAICHNLRFAYNVPQKCASRL